MRRLAVKVVDNSLLDLQDDERWERKDNREFSQGEMGYYLLKKKKREEKTADFFQLKAFLSRFLKTYSQHFL